MCATCVLEHTAAQTKRKYEFCMSFFLQLTIDTLTVFVFSIFQIVFNSQICTKAHAIVAHKMCLRKLDYDL